MPERAYSFILTGSVGLNSGAKFSVRFDDASSAGALKEHARNNLPSNLSGLDVANKRVRLIRNGQVLADGKRLKDVDIPEDQHLHFWVDTQPKEAATDPRKGGADPSTKPPPKDEQAAKCCIIL